MRRRGFLAGALHALLAGALTAPALRAAASTLTAEDSPGGGLSAAEWKTVSAVLEHLLPSELGVPGAREIHAAEYLRAVLSDPRLDPAAHDRMRAGIADLAHLCTERYATAFEVLASAEREAVLRALESTAGGEAWLGEMLDFLLEALLGDPSYGGNPDGVGWKWLGIDPGFPTPRLR